MSAPRVAFITGKVRAATATAAGVERTMADQSQAPIKPIIAPEDLSKIDIRVGLIEKVEDVEGSRKLVRLTVSFGDHTRAILAGMKEERENPAEIVGKQALFIVNLAPKKMAGTISEGMLLDIGYADGLTPVLAVPETPVPSGSRLG